MNNEENKMNNAGLKQKDLNYLASVSIATGAGWVLNDLDAKKLLNSGKEVWELSMGWGTPKYISGSYENVVKFIKEYYDTPSLPRGYTLNKVEAKNKLYF